MKELEINDLSLVFGGNPILKTAVTIAGYVVTREIVDPIYDRIRENIVNTPIGFVPVPIRVNVSPSWTEGRTGNTGLGYHYMPGSSYPTKNCNKNQSGSDYGDGCDYQ